MLFKNFKQNKDEKAVDSHLKKFKDQFTDKQKKTIIQTLYSIAQSDGEYHEKEDAFFKETANLLGYELNEDFDQQAEELLHFSEDEQAAVLNSLSDDQKDWFVVTVVGMVHVDGAVIEDELKYSKQLFYRMGITEQRFKDIINNSETIKESIN